MKRLLVAIAAAAILSAAAPAAAQIPAPSCCRAGTTGKVTPPRRPLPIIKSCCQAGTRGNTGIFFA